jgi:uncharacterized protein YcfJ
MLMASLVICAAQAETYSDYAKVRSVVPQYDRLLTPQRECVTERIRETRRVEGGGRDMGAVVIGGIAGALIGNQVGGGHGREAATAAGAVIGALSGERIARRDVADHYEEVPRDVLRCRQIESWQSRLMGYQVTYEYQGQRYTRLMNNDPGPQVRVRVSVEPE